MGTTRTYLPSMFSLRPSESSSLSATAHKERSQHDVTRYIAFASAIASCLCAGSIYAYSLYGHLFQERLDYTQMQVNFVIIGAELALYLPVPIFGYLCDRLGPAPLSFASAFLFSLGYLLAAFTYRSGAKDVYGFTHARGWPLWFMVTAFVLIGLATTLMYMSAISTCAKNFGKGKHKGLALASPIAAFGLSGVWQSQIGTRIFYEQLPNGKIGDLDVFKFFLFLALILLVVGVAGGLLQKIVDEDELINEAVGGLERNELLGDSERFRQTQPSYGSIQSNSDEHAEEGTRIDVAGIEDALGKTLLLNEETRRFLTDRTMWWLLAGFFMISGPAEAFITNLGTIVGTLYPPHVDPNITPTTVASHVSIVAISSTVARLVLGSVTDLLAPESTGRFQSIMNSSSSLPRRFPSFSISRVTFLIGTALLISIGQVLLALGLIQNHAERFWIVSSLVGFGYGALFSLTPLIISVVWGVENFATNWGTVAVVPAISASAWGLVYSKVYQRGVRNHSRITGGDEVLCYGKECYSSTFWAMAGSIWIGCGLWLWAWKGSGGWSRRGIAL